MNDKAQVKRIKIQSQLYNLATKPCAAPIFWRNERDELRNGTVTCISKGNQIFGVTAFHVINDCLKNYESFPEHTCQIGLANYEPKPPSIVHPNSYDISAFKLSEIYVNTTTCEPALWPTQSSIQDDLVLFGGYPGTHRVDSHGKIDFDYVSFIGKLTNSPERNISLALSIETSLSTSSERVQPHENLGGWSGGPVFKIIESPIAYVEVIGVIYEYSPVSEIVLAHPLSLLEEML